ncbi:hypothetical protein SAMN04489727_1834 [Amycolatopsis tolypomycina]|uniref:Uncharacterized protein n=1 Tax=Amycolatopsis tolypomycina TaxID=208445 RepID=A0A1H4JGN1_9PSEU|nr:hypothetical protein [Amycolatopsis tolypomycina]SEB44828.1 hypothetical protein SAMN04489727_1834 [Amycolatopsis tolypomycina]
MPTHWNDDDSLVADLGKALRARTEVPDRLVEIGKGAFAMRTVDAELATLTTAGLAGARAEPARLRTMTFTARDAGIELEVTEDALLGQVVPPRAGEVEVQTRDGAATTVTVDDVGWFVIRPRPAGLFRLLSRSVDGTKIVTEWTTA